ncbi:MAG: T9SS type A sorting domain-containing protein [Flavobacteriaceae bacterium]|nr:T9SS type A sorting domain-containing protein [Flavobacteriaceae bacterium]
MKCNYKNRLFQFLFVAILGLSTNAQVIEDGTYQIFNAVHQEVMSVETDNPFDAQMEELDEESDFQLWTFTHQGDDVYIIENNGTNTTLGINDGWCGNFGDVRVGYTPTDSNVEFRIVEAEEEDTYVIQIAFTECNFGSENDPIKAFDIQDGNSGAKIQTFEVNPSNPNQQFQILEPGTFSNNSFTQDPEFLMFFTKETRILNLNSNEIIETVEVFDLNGRKIKSNAKVQNQQAKIDFSAQKDGIYFVKYTINKKTYTAKTVIY